jgi:predicted ferric reductase
LGYLLQITIILPSLFIILHLSQIGFTDGLTFIFYVLLHKFVCLLLSVAISNSAFGYVVRAHRYLYFVAHAHPNGMLPHFAAQISSNHMAVG